VEGLGRISKLEKWIVEGWRERELGNKDRKRIGVTREGAKVEEEQNIKDKEQKKRRWKRRKRRRRGRG
jgi:hypothetical protein